MKKIENNSYTTFKISKICGVYPTTVINWINQKKLKAHVTPGGHHRVLKEDLLAFLKEYDFPVPAELCGRKKVFIVDDDEIFSSLIKRIFSKKDIFQVFVFKDGYQALMSLGKENPDLMVVDLVMPVMDGPTLCRKIKEDKNLSRIKIVAVSGERLSEDKKKELSKITDGFFEKPVEPSAFFEYCKNILGLGREAV